MTPSEQMEALAQQVGPLHIRVYPAASGALLFGLTVRHGTIDAAEIVAPSVGEAARVQYLVRIGPDPDVARPFPIEDIIGVTTGVLLRPAANDGPEGLHRLLVFLTGNPLLNDSGMQAVQREAANSLLEQHPVLRAAGAMIEGLTPENYATRGAVILADLRSAFGTTLPVVPMYRRRGPTDGPRESGPGARAVSR